MISYRERELMMVQKFLKDLGDELNQSMSDASESMENRTLSKEDALSLPEIKSYDELVERARECGYDTYIRAEDLLSAEELEQIERDKDKIEDEFRRLTKLEKVDYGFIIAATALQLLRQVVQPKLDFKNLNKDNRGNDKTADNDADKNKIKQKIDEIKNQIFENGIDLDESKKWYYASVAEIGDIAHVPYDAIKGTSMDGKFPIGMNGNNHRFKTLGHDPWLGYLFGTCNILTNTMTTSALTTYHVKNSKVVNNADTAKMFERSFERFKESRETFLIALIKQFYHIKSDEKSKKGLSLPFLQLFLDEKTIEKLCDNGLDYNNAKFLGTIAVQAGYAEMINFVIATIHRILMALEELKEQGIDESKLKAIADYDIFGKDSGLKEVRTRKMLMISNSIATAANGIFVAALTVGEALAEKPDFYKALENLDLGGAIITVVHLFKDAKVILKIKKDFIEAAIKEDFEKKLAELEIDG